MEPHSKFIHHEATFTYSDGNRTWEEPVPNELRDCFYRGHVASTKSKTAVIMNLCYGMSGSIFAEDDHLFIEQVHRDEDEDVELERKKLRPKYHQCCVGSRL